MVCVRILLCVCYLWYHSCLIVMSFFFFKQKTAYDMRISDWSSDVCSSDLLTQLLPGDETAKRLSDAGLARFGAREVDVGQQDIMSSACRDLGNARAHLPCPDDADDHMLPFR